MVAVAAAPVAPARPTIDELVGMPWHEYMAELEHTEQVLHRRDPDTVRALKALRLAPSLAVFDALMAGQPVPVDRLDPAWAGRYGL